MNWIGGATAVTQVATGTIAGNWDAPDTITTFILGEDGTTKQSVTTTATGTTEETDVLDPHLADLQASVLSYFTKVTWTKGSASTIVATAKTAGIPISGGVNGAAGTKLNYPRGTDSSTAGTGTYTFADTTANAGPNDFNTLANWVDDAETPSTAGALPTTSDEVKFLPHPTDEDVAGNPVSYDVLYGLNQSNTALASLRVPNSYRGTIGDSVNSYYLNIDVTDGSGVTVINSSCPALWLQGSHDSMTVAQTRNTAHALELGTGTITALRLLGAGVQGTITVKDGNVITNGWIVDVGGANIKIGTSGTVISTLETNAQRLQLDRGLTNLNASGGDITHTAGAIGTINNRGATIRYNGTSDVAVLNNYTGTFTTVGNRFHDIAVGTTSAAIWGGVITDRSGLKNVTWTTNIIVYGGTVQSDTASTQAQS
jgi:hypothetical protein